MSHSVTIASGKHNIALPDGNLYDDGDTVTLTDDQFARINSALIPGTIIDNGAVSDDTGTGLLAAVGYAPGSDTTILNAGASTTLADADATNLSLTFAVPFSGAVLVRLSALMAMVSGGQTGHWGLRNTSGVQVGTTNFITSLAAGGTLRYQSDFLVTGLISDAGSVVTWRWAYKVSSGGGMYIFGGPGYGKAIMEAWAVPA